MRRYSYVFPRNFKVSTVLIKEWSQSGNLSRPIKTLGTHQYEARRGSGSTAIRVAQLMTGVAYNQNKNTRWSHLLCVPPWTQSFLLSATDRSLNQYDQLNTIANVPGGT